MYAIVRLMSAGDFAVRLSVHQSLILSYSYCNFLQLLAKKPRREELPFSHSVYFRFFLCAVVFVGLKIVTFLCYFVQGSP